MAATYPGSVRIFTTKTDLTGPYSTVLAEHVNSLQEEMTATQTSLGTGILTSPWTGAFTQTGSWTNVATRLQNIEAGLTGDTHTQYVHKIGGDLMQASVTDPALRLRAGSSGQNIVDIRSSDGLTTYITVNEAGVLAASKNATVSNTLTVSAASVNTGLTVSGPSGQSANFFTINKNAAPIFSVESTGNIVSKATIFAINGPGTVQVEIGRVDGSGSTPYIDFHSGSTATDYDSRIVASGGTGSSGGGTLNLLATNLQHNGNTVYTSANMGAGSGLDADTLDGVQGADYARKLTTFNRKTDSYTLIASDADVTVEVNKSTAATVTIPPNSSVAFAVGTQINVVQTGAGQVTIAPGSGVTVNGTPGLKLRAQWSSVTLYKRYTDTWLVVGDVTS